MKNTYASPLKNFLVIGLFFTALHAFGQSETVPLWEDKIPNSQTTTEKETQTKGDLLWYRNVQNPTLEIYLPTKISATGRGVIICPGGGYAGLAYDWEGTDIAKWFNAKGIAAFVLKYRMPQSKAVIVSHKAPLQDAQRAIRLVREHAEKWNVSKNQIGIMGFSAGGHLAATLATHYNHQSYSPSDSIDTQETRPDFAILVYPVISMKEMHTHQGSKNNLLGKSPSEDLVSFYSNELHVTENTPPTLLIHSADDKGVPVSNSLIFYQALQEAGVYSEMHLYPYGGHGYSLAIGKGHLQTWPERINDWLESL